MDPVSPDWKLKETDCVLYSTLVYLIEEGCGRYGVLMYCIVAILHTVHTVIFNM